MTWVSRAQRPPSVGADTLSAWKPLWAAGNLLPSHGLPAFGQRSCLRDTIVVKIVQARPFYDEHFKINLICRKNVRIKLTDLCPVGVQWSSLTVGDLPPSFPEFSEMDQTLHLAAMQVWRRLCGSGGLLMPRDRSPIC